MEQHESASLMIPTTNNPIFSYTTSITTDTNYQNTPAIITPPEMDMDSRVWSKLPPRLLDRVISFLPAAAFFRARCVCKRLYGLLFSTSTAFLTRRRHCFLFSSHGGAWLFLFDPYELTWHRLNHPLAVAAGAFSSSLFAPAAAAGGVVCYVSTEAGAKSVVVCNPMTGSIAPLPPAPTPRLFPSVGIAVTPSSIDVTVAGDDLISPYAVKNLTSESFHVDAGGFYSAWNITSALPRLSSLESSGRVIHASGRFYAMNYSPFSVMAKDVAATSSQWWKIQAPMRRFLRWPNLIESRGRLVMVAAVEKSQLNVPKSLRMWGLQPCGTAWAETDRMPHQLYAQFEELEAGNGFSCVGHGEFVVIVVRGGANRGLLFNVDTKAWLWIPLCPYHREGLGDLQAFAYEPSLTTPVAHLLNQLN